ncbi:MAG: hypothetical protein QNJ77_10870 [Acidimicrobiia bacterium]|nr:hypothetical protein [Acidimicrobiia bacterium]
MCTIGVSRFDDEGYILFKNKDFARRTFEDRLVVEPNLFGVAGLATWAASDAANDVMSGVSLGTNPAGLMCADANVHGAEGNANYDELVEVALRTSGGVEEAIAAVQAAAASQPYLWANIIMIDADTSAVVEVRGSAVAAIPCSGATARSNHHLQLAVPGEQRGSPTTESRLVSAQRRLKAARGIADVLALQRSHDDGETGVCAHEGHQTVYSYALHRRSDTTTLHVVKGHPCRTDEPVELVVPVGSTWSTAAATGFRSGYPSAEATHLV